MEPPGGGRRGRSGSAKGPSGRRCLGASHWVSLLSLLVRDSSAPSKRVFPEQHLHPQQRALPPHWSSQ
eukprot:6187991-Alexandrium_andersonii.AAC.1